MVGVGVVAMFRCDYPDARFIGWKVNNSDLETQSFPNITIDDQSRVLTILALPEYNGTMIVCEALPRNGNLIPSPSANLFVQGNPIVLTQAT